MTRESVERRISELEETWSGATPRLTRQKGSGESSTPGQDQRVCDQAMNAPSHEPPGGKFSLASVDPASSAGPVPNRSV